MTDESSDETLGDRLRRARKRAKLTNAQIGAAVGKTPVTVSRWMTDVSTPSADDLGRVAATLGVSVAWLKGEPESEPARVREPAVSYGSYSVERPLPRVVQSHAVRVWLREFELELARAGVPDVTIAEARDVLTAPKVFVYFAGGSDATRELTEADALRAMNTMAAVIRTDLRERGYPVPPVGPR